MHLGVHDRCPLTASEACEAKNKTASEFFGSVGWLGLFSSSEKRPVRNHIKAEDLCSRSSSAACGHQTQSTAARKGQAGGLTTNQGPQAKSRPGKTE